MDPAMDDFDFHPGTTPLLVSVPHAGTRLPEGLAERLTPGARALPDTDWFVDALYGFVRERGAGLLVARWSRYVVDLNRPPGDEALYAARTTGLVPLETFDGQPLYGDKPPDESEVRARRDRYWKPYHDALDAALGELRARHGHAVLLDAHSIRSEVPGLFEGRLPHFNLGTWAGRSAAPGLAAGAEDILVGASAFETVRDARFKGGYITRHYGRPHEGVHALQLEMAQRSYMREVPPEPEPGRAARVKPVLEKLVSHLQDWTPE